jgi:hypothetical protein
MPPRRLQETTSQNQLTEAIIIKELASKNAPIFRDGFLITLASVNIAEAQQA